MLKMNAFYYRQDKTMCNFSAHAAFYKAADGQTYMYIYIQKTITFSKLDLREGGSISTRSIDSDIELSVYSVHVSCCIPVCSSVALLKATYAENVAHCFLLSIL